MGERKIDKENLNQFLNSRAKVILANQMHYTGNILSIGDTFLVLRDKYDVIVNIIIEKICSIEKEAKNG